MRCSECGSSSHDKNCPIFRQPRRTETTELPTPENNVAGNAFGRRKAIHELKCISEPMGCGRQLTADEYNSWDALTRKEYRQSGWCNNCQDKVFADPDDNRCTCDDPPCCEVDVGVGTITCGAQHQRPCPQHPEKEANGGTTSSA